MNIENINRLITHLRGVPEHDFSMCFSHRYFNDGMCIGGHAAELFNLSFSPADTLRFSLGLKHSETMRITYPDSPADPAWRATIPQAIRLLEILRDEGVVDWGRALIA